MLQAQAKADSAYFMQASGTCADADRAAQLHATVLKAYRWQYIVSGVMEPRFQKLLGEMITPAQMQRILDGARAADVCRAAALHDDTKRDA